ncbi:hypothetical protein GCM10022261_04100 [Brevibacterium daeguense]|uniref:Gram-positive cocci surface proteins LPxTG domain-containing protein n=1 Tax=Brevibacterium daeguense TaxID=909936 RepID=A0ABP8EFY1_9MICO|nr:bifunctional UDP-sugar hydrolase/5'-nucleotidase [Brevibacterium daeguense]
MKRTALRYAVGTTAAAGLMLPLGLAPALADAPEGTQIQLLGITDFHGRLADSGVNLASVVERERAENSSMGTALLSTGDNIGASTYESSSQEDTPTLEYLNALGLDATATGNHEYDRGYDDLVGRVSDTANFPHLAANVYEEGTSTVAAGLEEYTILDVDGVRVAVIGVVTEDTESLVSPDGIASIDFGDPTEAVNRVAADLEELPEDERPDATVVQAHLGPSDVSSLSAAVDSNAEFGTLVTEADESIDAMFFGHSHTGFAFEAEVPGTDRTRPVVQSGYYGDRVGQVILSSEGDGTWTTDEATTLDTEDVTYDSPVVAEAERIIDEAVAASQEIGSEVAGEITEDITRAFNEDGSENRGGESTLGNLVADALKEGAGYTQLGEADFGITNPGGLRTDLLVDGQFGDEAPGEVTIGELNQVLPFANDHGVVTMLGSDVIGLFEEQWQPAGASRPFLHLGISEELEVIYDSEAEAGERVLSVEVNGEEIDPNAEYRVATLSFLAAGGDNFASFANGDFEQSGMTDFEVWERYFNENTPVSPDTDERQADAALDIVLGGTTEATISTEDDNSGEFTFETTNEDEITGPFLLSLDLPEGLSADFGEYAVDGGARIDSLPAGGAALPFTVTGEPGEYTFTASVVADPDAEWWDDNPMPLVHETEVTFTIAEDQDATPGGDDDGRGADDDDQGSDDDNQGSDDGRGADDGTGADDDQRGDDDQAAGGSDRGGDLPRTGSEITAALGAALLLLAAGTTAVIAVRRKTGSSV